MTVYENPGINQQDVIRGEGQNSKLRRLKEFVQNGLVREISSSEGRTSMRYYPTSEGERICRLLHKIEGGDEVEPMDYDAPSQEGDSVSR